VVVGTDVNPRAVALARINAAINGIAADFREGDRFAPVAGETFDVILSHPPFIPRPEGTGAASAVYGGLHGDELALSMLAKVPAHLTPTGRAVFLVEWPEHGVAPLEQRLRDVVGPGQNLLILGAPPTDLASRAVAYAAGFHPQLGPAFEADVVARLDHFEQAGIRALLPTLVVVEHAAGSEGWSSTVSIEPLALVSIDSERLAKMLAARALAGDRDALLAATLRVPAGTVLSQVRVGPGADVPPVLSARFPPSAAVPPIDMTMELLFLVTAVHEAAAVRDALPRFAEKQDLAPEEAMEKGLPAVGEALLYGILEVASAPLAP
jgi:hypothetical protein